MRGEAEFALSRALWATGKRTRARELAALAVKHLDAGGDPAVKAARAWQAELGGE